MNFTLNNHLKYWIGDRLYGHRKYPDEKYRVEVGKVDQDYFRTSNWVKEQHRTADAIYKDYRKDFVVMFSGGTDSEIVIRSFVAIGIKPRCVFLRFADELNHDDYLNAQSVCTGLDLVLEVVDFDVKEFYYSGAAAEFSAGIDCRQIAYLNVYYHIKQLGIPAVMGGEMLMRRHVIPKCASKWYYVIRENEDASAIRFSLKYNIPLVNEWFSYTPEMMAYHLQHPKVQWLFSEKFNYKLGSVSTKNEILFEYIPELRKKTKTHGYERLLGFNAESYNVLAKTHISRLEDSLDGIFIDDLLQMLHGENYNGNN